jgi:cytoskeletal protein CcmA (bactofilin family)
MAFGRFRDDSSTSTTKGAEVLTPALGVVSSRSEVVIGRGTRIKGTVNLEGTSVIDGIIDGEIFSKDSLTIGDDAVINATITGSEVIVRGTVTGDITATQRIVLKKPARLSGNVTCPALVIEEGVTFEGRCSMGKEGQFTESSTDGVRTLIAAN